jgi:heptosyltransferase-2
LAARLERVVLVGSRDDLVAQRTYFRDAKPWPAHVQSLIGTLSLADTAALLSECSALVSNDSGLMHIGAALGIPTFGIFGLTSPARELMPLPNAHAVTKGLPCEAACRLRPWGRCDCEHHLQCLRTLQPDEVLEAIRETLSSRTRALGKTA